MFTKKKIQNDKPAFLFDYTKRKFNFNTTSLYISFLFETLWVTK